MRVRRLKYEPLLHVPQQHFLLILITVVELALLRNPRYPLGKAYLKQYREVVHITEPEEDADSRNIMYLVRHQVCLASIYPNDPKLREMYVPRKGIPRPSVQLTG